MRRLNALALALLSPLLLISCPDTTVPTLGAASGARACSAYELAAFRAASTEDERRDLWIAFVDVGQGDATWIRTPGLREIEAREILVDAGDCQIGAPAIENTSGVGQCGITSNLQDDHTSPGIVALINFLTESGWPPGSFFDTLVVTHTDKDHYGGAWSILDLYQVNAYMDPGREADQVTYDALMSKLSIEPGVWIQRPAWARGFDPDMPDVRMTRGWGRDVEVELLSADVNAGSDNDSSVVLSVRYRGVHILLMGDAEAPLDEALVAAHGDKLQADVLHAGHHGGAGTSTAPLLEAVFPPGQIRGQRVVILSSGRRENLPAEETLARLEAKSSLIYRTDRGDESKDRATSPGDDHILLRVSEEGELTLCYAYAEQLGPQD
ncbi:MBL fold metallo-hydrolase [Myxococcota bacterium]|nr:MBL fold metallo-hydrolase [Myxococcota bacterium]MBU1433200.1 MBL fold metallo-hydrolase [Myxococcota bacterium]MBU1898339.1 MBL fold metallo-hydrolase [Myxococcota bacterium]